MGSVFSGLSFLHMACLNWITIGRPQRDGPALRTTAIVAFAKSQPPSYLKNTAWPVLKLDLDYLTNFWNQTGFDLWEELDGSSFFTLSATHRALREGVVAAKAVGDTARAKSYGMQAKNVLCFLQVSYLCGTPSMGLRLIVVLFRDHSLSGHPGRTILFQISTLAQLALVSMPTPSFHPYTILTLRPAATLTHSNHAQTKRLPTTKPWSTRFARYILLTRASLLAVLPLSVVMQRMYTSMAMCVLSFLVHTRHHLICRSSLGSSRTLLQPSSFTTLYGNGTTRPISRSPPSPYRSSSRYTPLPMSAHSTRILIRIAQSLAQSVNMQMSSLPSTQNIHLQVVS